MAIDDLLVLRLSIANLETFNCHELVSAKKLLIIISETSDLSRPLVESARNETLIDLLNSVNPPDFVTYIEQPLGPLLFPALREFVQDISQYSSIFSLLIDRRISPADSRRYEGEVSSFIFRGLSWTHFDCSSTPSFMLCYTLLHGILAGSISCSALLVSQLPYIAPQAARAPDRAPDVAVIIPHRHTFKYLELTLDYVARLSWPSKVRAAVGLDVDDLKPYLALMCRPDIEMYHCPSFVPAGPYVFRDRLIEAAPEPLFIFQDSDDVPCTDRLAVLYEGLCSTNADVVGSHEVELNEIDKTIRAYRFPLDVSSVLRNPEEAGVSANAAEPFLHATAMIRSSAFRSSGGFSTNRRIANDSQFLLRASLSLKITNVDCFAYIRRVHRAALTVAPETHNGNALRQALSDKWSEDFRKIKRGELDLEQSSLAAVKSPLEIVQI